MINSFKRLLEEDSEFQPILWTNNVNIEQLDNVQSIKNQVPKLQIKSIDEFHNDPLYEHLLNLMRTSR
jgi:hypothetical protein